MALFIYFSFALINKLTVFGDQDLKERGDLRFRGDVRAGQSEGRANQKEEPIRGKSQSQGRANHREEPIRGKSQSEGRANQKKEPIRGKSQSSSFLSRLSSKSKMASSV
ncbi:Hypothetical predicted protein [Xyrichtys novacula]|uniref:Uncharacterized protein n=1 Tax=Xyrichtys novacula TaxID=13765 RepID=A0AAV1H9D6_XYRNO|nr:Hypothetical predicted protein [Xyrichtys novacula]